MEELGRIRAACAKTGDANDSVVGEDPTSSNCDSDIDELYSCTIKNPISVTSPTKEESDDESIRSHKAEINFFPNSVEIELLSNGRSTPLKRPASDNTGLTPPTKM